MKLIVVCSHWYYFSLGPNTIKRVSELQQLLTHTRWHRCINFEMFQNNTDFNYSRIECPTTI